MKYPNSTCCSNRMIPSKIKFPLKRKAYQVGRVGVGVGVKGKGLGSNLGLRWFVYTCYECMVSAAPQGTKPKHGKSQRESTLNRN